MAHLNKPKCIVTNCISSIYNYLQFFTLAMHVNLFLSLEYKLTLFKMLVYLRF